MMELAKTKPPNFELNAMSALFHIPENPPPQLPVTLLHTKLHPAHRCTRAIVTSQHPTACKFFRQQQRIDFQRLVEIVECVFEITSMPIRL
jgi:hypothetical protein